MPSTGTCLLVLSSSVELCGFYLIYLLVRAIATRGMYKFPLGIGCILSKISLLYISSLSYMISHFLSSSFRSYYHNYKFQTPSQAAVKIARVVETVCTRRKLDELTIGIIDWDASGSQRGEDDDDEAMEATSL
jgi:hypothetical protein